MRTNSFSVRVVGGREVDGGYVEMRHGQQYSLRLSNQRGVRCDVRVEIDGKDIGTFRVDSYGSIELERMPDDSGRFTFYRTGSSEGDKIGLSDIPSSDRGLIRVTFTPEKRTTVWVYNGTPIETVYPEDSDVRCCSVTDSYESGGTGLSGHSSQSFTNVGALDYDYDGKTVIHLRLVYKDTDEPRPLVAHTTPVPPPVR